MQYNDSFHGQRNANYQLLSVRLSLFFCFKPGLLMFVRSALIRSYCLRFLAKTRKITCTMKTPLFSKYLGFFRVFIIWTCYRFSVVRAHSLRIIYLIPESLSQVELNVILFPRPPSRSKERLLTHHRCMYKIFISLKVCRRWYCLMCMHRENMLLIFLERLSACWFLFSTHNFEE